MEQRIEQAKQVMSDWFRLKERQANKRINEIREFLKKNNLLAWVKNQFPTTVRHTDPILVYESIPVKVVGIFGETRPSDYLKNKSITVETEGVDALIFVFVISSYGWIQFWWEGRWAGSYNDPYGVDYFIERLVATNCPNLVKVVGDILDEGVRWWEMAYERATEVLLRQLDSQAKTLNEMVIDLQLSR